MYVYRSLVRCAPRVVVTSTRGASACTTLARACSTVANTGFPRVDVFGNATWSGTDVPGDADRVVFRSPADAERETGLKLPAGGVAPAAGARGSSDPLVLVANVGDVAGKSADATHAALRKAATAAMGWMTTHRRARVAVDVALPAEVVGSASAADATRAVTQASLLATYTFPKYLSVPSADSGEDAPHRFESISFGGDAADADGADFTTTRHMCNATALARDLATERADVATPEYMAAVANSIAADFDSVTCKVMDDSELWERGLHLLYSVGQGAVAADKRPRLVTLEYRGNPSSDAVSVALVGKGITFDTGGLNLKPTGFMEEMHADMSGSAAVTAAMRAIAAMNLPINVVAAMPFAENSIGPDAVKPHAIVKSYKGLTVQINNTDAEGRLALVDAFTHVQREYNAPVMIDMATLTGACVVALGEPVAGLFGNDDSVVDSLRRAGSLRHERCWHMPILPEHTAELASKVADTRSTGKTRYGGACTAAAFLQKFVEDGVKWAHVDIAGPAMPADMPTYSGFGAQLLAQFVADASAGEAAE